MSLTSKDVELAIRTAVKVHDCAVAKERSIQPADQADLLQDLAMKLLRKGNSSRATTARQWGAFLVRARKYLRMEYVRNRAAALARFAYEQDVEGVARKGDRDDDDEGFKRAVLDEMRDRFSSKSFDAYLDATSAGDSRPMTPAERQRKSRAERAVDKVLLHHLKNPLPD